MTATPDIGAADQIVEKAAGRLDDVAAKATERGGIAETAVPLLEEDADFLRTMTPSKVAARIRGSSDEPGLSAATSDRSVRSREPSAIPVLAAAFGVGFVLAKIIDWRALVESRR